MLVIRPKIFNGDSGILCGISTRGGNNRTTPYFFNLSYSVNDDPENVKKNRAVFFASFGLKEDRVAFQTQVHSDTISFPASGGNCGESDAMITSEKGLALAISTADCAPVFISDPVNKVIAGVHSGWRSTEKEITAKVIRRMSLDFGSKPEDLLVYMGPSICGSCYEVGSEFKEKFDKKYLHPHGDKYMLDLPLRNYHLLLNSGVNKNNIQISKLCTYEKRDLLHSYRRDGATSGRALGLIVMSS